jgi:hypothetical protein
MTHTQKSDDLLLSLVFPLKKVIITIQIGKIAFIMAPKPTNVFDAPVLLNHYSRQNLKYSK